MDDPIMTIEEQVERIPELAPYFSAVVLFVRECQKQGVGYSPQIEDYPVDALFHVSDVPHFFPDLIVHLKGIIPEGDKSSLFTQDEDTIYVTITRLTEEAYRERHPSQKQITFRPLEELRHTGFRELGSIVFTCSQSFDTLGETIIIDRNEVPPGRKKECLIQ